MHPVPPPASTSLTYITSIFYRVVESQGVVNFVEFNRDTEIFNYVILCNVVRRIAMQAC